MGRMDVGRRSSMPQELVAIARAGGTFFWSPNSRYLFGTAGNNNKLFAFDRDTRDFIPLGVNNVLALASRPS